MGSRSLTAIRKLRGWVRDDGRKSEERSLGFARDDKKWSNGEKKRRGGYLGCARDDSLWKV
jgi:hypothetical protein